MPRIHRPEQALTLFTLPSRPQYVCRACRAHAVRQIYTSRALNAEVGFFQRMRQSIFGSDETREAAKKREEKSEERAKNDAARSEVKTKRDTKGRVYQVAAAVDSSSHPEYVEATNWDGLRRMGSEQWVKEQLDEGYQYLGFMPTQRANLNKLQWQKLLHHVAVETLALQKAGRNLNEACLHRSKDDECWRYTQTVKIAADDETGKATVMFKTEKAEQIVLSAMPHTDSKGEAVQAKTGAKQKRSKAFLRTLRGIVDQSITPELLQDTAWMTVPIKGPLVKLAIAKRVLQLTGHRISDPVLSNVTTLADLYNTLITPEPPKKLSMTPELLRLKESAPNVQVHARRQTPIDKETAIGRWKVIEEELIARDLPVTGSRWQDAKPRLGVER